MTRPRPFLLAAAAVLMFGAWTVPHARAADEPTPPRRQGGGAGGGLLRDNAFGLFRNEKVQKDLELTDEQKESIKKVEEQFREATKDTTSGLRDLSQEERRKKLTEIREKLAPKLKEVQEKINGVLNAKQRDRLNELKIQARGAAALLDKDTAEALKLSDDQQKKLKGLEEARNKEFAEVMESARGGNPGDAREKFTKLRKESNDKMLEVLSSDQKAQFEKMQGTKIELGQAGTGGGRPRNRSNQ